MTISALILVPLLLFAFQDEDAAHDKALESLVNAERHFAAVSVEKGFHQAFVENMADDGLVFAPGPVNGKKLHANAPESNAILNWYPAYAAISRSLDWGYTTGPYEFKANPEAKEPAGAGFYLSVWKKQPDGTWKVAVDMGNSFPASLIKEEKYLPAPVSKSIETGTTDELLATDVQKVQPYQAETLIYRHDEYPVKYKDVVIEPAANITYTNLGFDVASAGDMAYTYGSFTQLTSQGDVTGHYLKVWEVKNGQWQLSAHNLVPDKK